MQKACILSNIFRFIDDLCTFKNDKFENNYNDIYPDELEIKKENKGPCKVSFLDFLIEVHHRKFKTKLFVYRTAFSFYINRMLYIHSNIPFKILYTLYNGSD